MSIEERVEQQKQKLVEAESHILQLNKEFSKLEIIDSPEPKSGSYVEQSSKIKNEMKMLEDFEHNLEMEFQDEGKRKEWELQQDIKKIEAEIMELDMMEEQVNKEKEEAVRVIEAKKQVSEPPEPKIEAVVPVEAKEPAKASPEHNPEVATSHNTKAMTSSASPSDQARTIK